jgi:pyrroloquinoline quinone biosynthesis protein B
MSRTSRRGAAGPFLLALVVALSACSAGSPSTTTPSPATDAATRDATQPYVLVLGTAQDGGLPHAGCFEGNCAKARLDASRRRLVTSLLLCDPRDGRRWLFDCTPDLRDQLDRARGHPAKRAELDAAAEKAGTRPAPFDGIFLTHAHTGHYAGLVNLGREAYGVHDVPTYVTPRFADFLRHNGPWSLMVDEKRLALRELAYDAPVELAPDLHVTAFRVPHREEFSDVVGFAIRGPHKTLVYLPDVDKWEQWDVFAPDGDAARARHVEDVVASCDVALLDGCFFADGEVRGRSMKEIPHPFVVESIARFRKLPLAQREKVFFTHLNHTNPCADVDGDAWRAVVASGMHVLDEGRVFGL